MNTSPDNLANGPAATSAANAAASASSAPESARGRYVFQAFAVILACTMVAGLLLVLSTRFSTRIDLSATRAHRLADATKAVLAELPGQSRIIIAANTTQSDPDSVARLNDVLAAYEAASPNLKVTRLDISNSADLARFDETLREIAAGEAPAIERHIAACNTIIESLENVGSAIGGASAGFERIGKAITDGLASDPKLSPADRTAKIDKFTRAWQTQLASYRAMGEQLRRSSQSAQKLMGQTLDPLKIPRIDEVEKIGREELRRALPLLTKLSDDLTSISRGQIPEFPEAAREPASALALSIAPARDRAARAVAALDALPKLRVLSVLNAVSRTQAALIIGPPPIDAGPNAPPVVTAVSIDELLPPTRLGPDGKPISPPDQRARTEERITAALAALTNQPRPLVIITHAFGVKMAPTWPLVGSMVEFLALRGIDVDEWSLGLMPEPPAAATEAAAKGRPIVFLVIAPEVRSQESALRMGQLAASTEQLLKSGASFMLCTSASSTKAAGAADAMTSFLEPMGITINSGKMLLEQGTGGPRRIVSPYLQPIATNSTHPVGLAVDGISLFLPWCVPVTLNPAAAPEGTQVFPILRTSVGKDIWAESDWQNFRAMSDADRAAMPNPPLRMDAPGDDDGSSITPEADKRYWTIAAGMQRLVNNRVQRVVAIGSIGWLADQWFAQRSIIDGREMQNNPGNGELLAASINWLAGRDSLVAPGALAQQGATIPNLSSTLLGSLRWGFIAILPIAILLYGALRRVLRG